MQFHDDNDVNIEKAKDCEKTFCMNEMNIKVLFNEDGESFEECMMIFLKSL